MPFPLRALTLLSLLAPPVLLLGMPLAPSVSVFGRSIERTQWWSSGAGVLATAALVLMFVSGVLLLRRRRVGRAVHVLAWCGLTGLVPAVVGLLHTGVPPMNHSTITTGMITICVGFYLYGQSTARRYFAAG